MTATLHHERVAGAAATSWLVMTHGIYGAGGNWRSIARQLVGARPDWGCVLVDLRGHGRSEQGDPPHTIDACAADMTRLIAAVSADGAPVRAICGHSFGGKVVIATRRHVAQLSLRGGSRPASPDGRGGEPRVIEQTWMLDSTPGAHPDRFAAPDNTVRLVLELMEQLPQTFARRADFVDAVIAGGQTPALAQWLAMNLVPIAPASDALRLRLDLAQIRALLDDYFRADLWPAIETPGLAGTVHAVVAGASRTVNDADRARLAAAERTTLHVVPDAGHWLHIDAPAAVVELLAAQLPR
jgi:pimeloyl-ACP methyl ester carboxylesterase